MLKRAGWLIIFISFFLCYRAFCQQDVDFSINQHLLVGKQILKVRHDYNDPYLWVLAQNNQVYRINSLTFEVDDYSTAFSAYSNLQFIDIAGYSADTVYVATKSPEVIEYEKGILKTIGPSQGLIDTVTSIGICTNGINYGQLLIGTTSGVGVYGETNETLTYNPWKGQDFGPANIFATTYRSTIYTDYYYGSSDSTDYPIVINTQFSTYGSYIYRSPANSNINTAFYTVIPEIGIYNGSVFWGNENGLFQGSTHWNNAYPTTVYSFLNGIKVNKIVDILGLTNFSVVQNIPPIDKDNLLVGTNNGLYFSSSLYDNTTNGVSAFSLFHDDELGNIQINDICTNASVYNLGIHTPCENGVWLATPNGIYYIIPNYVKYLDPNIQLLNSIYFNVPGSNPSTSIQLCSGSSILILFNRYIQFDNTIQWQKNGKDIPGAVTDTLAVTDSGDYNVIVHNPCENVSLSTIHLKVSLVSGPQFTFNYPDTIQTCDLADTTLNVTYSPSYHYRWYQNDVLNGDTTSSLTVTQSGKYKVEVSACTNSWVPSKEVQVNLFSVPDPGIGADKSVYCEGDTATLSSTWLLDSTYTINWYKDGVLQSAYTNQEIIKVATPGNYALNYVSNSTGCSKTSSPLQLSFTPAPTFTFNYPGELDYCAGSTITLTAQGSPNYQYRWYKNDTLTNQTTSSIGVTQGGTYKVEVSACPNSWVPSKEVLVNLVQLPVPAITADKAAYCTGDNATLSINTTPDPYYIINWYRDNILLPAYTNQYSIATNIAGNYTAAVVSTTTNTDGSVCSQTSTVQAITFNPMPSLSIQQMVNTTLCQGQSVGLKAVYTSGTIKWSTGQATDEIAVTASGTYTATLSTLSGCTVDDSTNVAFLPDPILNVSDTTICTFKNQTVTLTAPAGYVKYAWNNVPGNQTYNVTTPQTVALTVTDANDCQTTQQIHVTEQCPDVEIPNAFTPNGDGINDTWNVQGLDNTSTVKIFTRYGSLLYQSKGYTTPWNGTYHNQKLPAGVYYYVITVKGDKQTYSGSLTILY